MKVSIKKDSDKKIASVVKNLEGRRFDYIVAEELFQLEDQGYILEIVGKAIQQKYKNFCVAYYRKAIK